jgi:hypothetical protein
MRCGRLAKDLQDVLLVDTIAHHRERGKQLVAVDEPTQAGLPTAYVPKP